jgi:hypothetical protein
MQLTAIEAHGMKNVYFFDLLFFNEINRALQWVIFAERCAV